jgi:hypothetical protein
LKSSRLYINIIQAAAFHFTRLRQTQMMDAINTPHTGLDPSKDLEKSLVPSETSVDVSPADVVPSADRSLWTRLSEAGVELRGAQPVPVELRTDTRYFNIFTIFSTSMTSLLPYVGQKTHRESQS